MTEELLEQAADAAYAAFYPNTDPVVTGKERAWRGEPAKNPLLRPLRKGLEVLNAEEVERQSVAAGWKIGTRITDGNRTYVVVGELEDYTLYVEGDTPMVHDRPTTRKHVEVVELPKVRHHIDQSAIPYYREARG